MPKVSKEHWVSLCVQVHRAVMQRLDIVAKESGKSKSEIVRDALARELDIYERGLQKLKEEKAHYG